MTPRQGLERVKSESTKLEMGVILEHIGCTDCDHRLGCDIDLT